MINPPKFLFLLIFFLLFFLIQTAFPRIHLVTQSHNEISHDGIFIEANDNYLTLAPSGAANNARIHIPVNSIRSVSWIPQPNPSAQLWDHLSRSQSIWQLFDLPSTNFLIAEIETLASAGNWAGGYHHVESLLRHHLHADQRLRLTILKAWFLFEMGLHQAAANEVEKLTQSVPLLETPLRLSWLGARMALVSGDEAKALRWAALPFLQIPTPKDPLVDDLLQISLRSSSRPRWTRFLATATDHQPIPSLETHQPQQPSY